MNVFIAIPNMGHIHTELMFRVLEWYRDYGIVPFAPSRLQPMAYARNVCVERFLESDASHLLFIDADTLPTVDALKLLVDAEKQAITGVYYTQKQDSDGTPKFVTVVARRYPEGLRPISEGFGIERIHASGGGCLLLEREVFRKVEFPWFEDRSWGDQRGDFLFCKKLEDAGIEMYAHFGIVCRHRKEVDL